MTRRSAALVAVLGVLAAVLAACARTPAVPAPDVLPPAQAVADATGTWATVAMGHLDDPPNTFGELLYRPTDPGCPRDFAAGCGSRDWTLATPPGVASNGGLFAATNPDGTLTAGFGVSLDLTFSPLAESGDHGAVWTGGILPAALVPVTDALASSGPTARLALVSAGGGQVLSARGDLSTWAVLARRATLDPVAAASGCALGSLTAVAVTSTGDDLVAGTCGSGARAGVFRVAGAGAPSVVTAVGPRVPVPSGTPVRVDRLVATPAGLSALVVAGSGPSSRLFLASSADGAATWTVSAPYPTGSTVASASVGADGGMVVVLTGSRRAAATVATVGARWSTLPPLPAGTAVVTVDGRGSYSALVPSGSSLDVEVLTGGTWTPHQELAVPIPYGSTSAGGGSG